MPAHDAERHIDEAIASVLAQRGPRLELLVGDDGSTDGTWARIRAHTTDRRVRAFRFRVCRGAAATRNRLLARARGRFVAPCDADDQLLPGALARLTRALRGDPRAGVAYGAMAVVDVRGR